MSGKNTLPLPNFSRSQNGKCAKLGPVHTMFMLYAQAFAAMPPKSFSDVYRSVAIGFYRLTIGFSFCPTNKMYTGVKQTKV